MVKSKILEKVFSQRGYSTSLYTQNQNGLNSEKRVSFSENKESPIGPLTKVFPDTYEALNSFHRLSAELKLPQLSFMLNYPLGLGKQCNMDGFG